ncbi:MAG: ATP-dependent DNA helicase RecG [Acidobacteriota bacterium]
MTLGGGSPLSAIKGIGPAAARSLAAAGLVTIEDLLWYLPYRYEDRSQLRPIASLLETESGITVAGELTRVGERFARSRRLRIVEAVVADTTGALPVVWFNQPYLARSLHKGCRVWLHGALRAAPGGGRLQLVNPEWEVEDEDDAPLHVGRIVPIYRRAGSFSGRRLRSLVARVLEELAPAPEVLAPWLPHPHSLPTLDAALRAAHFPSAGETVAGVAAALAELAARRSPAHRRLALEELLALAVTLEREKQRRRGRRAVACVITEEIRARARALLPFRLTPGQRRVVAEIVADLRQPHPMARLLQGDVGSGKTIVALLAVLVALESGAQAALLAPTELLAQQHFFTLQRLLSRAAQVPELLIGSMPARAKQAIRERLASGAARFVVGTHALIEDDVAFARLGLVVIDEQHRFGAAQRQALVGKGEAPHLLVMTATPIPRSLALTLYGDLEVSVLDELPPGRTAIRTALRDDRARARMADFLLHELAAGGQIYWVFPLIEESEKLSLRAVTAHLDAVKAALPGARVGVVHGRLAGSEREATMAAFASKQLDVLCATTVIEVGVDVPNASVMVIENAERFGLAQLHQLRGRVGRGERRSICILLAGADCSGEARRRLELFASTTDGFRIAEEDFAARGPGELTGLRQWGRPELRFADLRRHRAELELARELAASAAAAGTLDALAAALERHHAVGDAVAPG